jgi:hypothetical protein
LDDSGAVLELRLVGARPGGEFADALAELQDDWSFVPIVELNEDGCSMAGVRYIGMIIRIPGDRERGRDGVRTPILESVYPYPWW